MAMYQEKETVITTGLYSKGTSPELDLAIEMHDKIEEFLKQEEFEPSTMKQTLDKLSELTGIEIPESEYSEAPQLVLQNEQEVLAEN